MLTPGMGSHSPRAKSRMCAWSISAGAPILVAPFIMLGVLDGRAIESTAPQVLIYDWMLQFGIALVPYIARRFFLKEENPQLGGCWGSLAAATAVHPSYEES